MTAVNMRSQWDTYTAQSPKKYKGEKLWDRVPQKMENATAEDYHNIAEDALPFMAPHMQTICDRLNLTHHIIPHEVYCREFEHGTKPFDEWLADYRLENGLSNTNVVIITRAKDMASSDRKNSLNPVNAEKVYDYLAGMFVVTPLHSSPKAIRESIDVQERLMVAIESDADTVAFKNRFWKPKEYGYRAHKSVVDIEIPEHSGLEYAGFSILSEIKIEHANQQDLNRLTRRFMAVKRDNEKNLPSFFQTCASIFDGDNAGRGMTKMGHKTKILDDFSRKLNDWVNMEGMHNRFLDTERRGEHTPREAELGQLYEAARRVISAPFGSKFKDEITTVLETLNTAGSRKFQRELSGP